MTTAEKATAGFASASHGRQSGVARVVRPIDVVGGSVDDGNPATRADYWDAFYSSSLAGRRPLPSQFAAFVAGELAEPARIIELGCGSGRDAIFFADNGHDVVAVDASAQAVASCQALARSLRVDAEFIAAAIDDPALAGLLPRSGQRAVVYARFFVHAITDQEEAHFLDLAASITRPGDLLAVEYRTIRDSGASKMTGRHYRRFVHPSAFDAGALTRGFEISYAVEGYGYAKYQGDDAYVARSLFVRR